MNPYDPNEATKYVPRARPKNPRDVNPYDLNDIADDNLRRQQWGYDGPYSFIRNTHRLIIPRLRRGTW